MIHKTTIVIPEKDLHLAYADEKYFGLEHAYLKQHVAQEQRVQVEQVRLQPPFVVDKKNHSVTFGWSLTH